MEENNQDIEQLYGSITQESSNNERPMTSAEETKQEAPAQTAFEIAFKARGEERKITDMEQAKQLLSKGYDYNELVSTLKKDQESVKTYKEIDEYAKNNPGWWEHVKKGFDNRDSYGKMQNQEHPNISNIPVDNPVLQELLEFKSNFQRQQELERISKEDAVLDKEITEIKEQFKQIDFSKLDNDGRTLEHRILEHANKSGINSFKAAAKDYLFDDIVKLAEEKGKESVKRNLEERSKLGLLGVSKAPLKELTSPVSIKDRSYEDLLKEALSEMGLDK